MARRKLHKPEDCKILVFPTDYVPEDMTPRERVTQNTVMPGNSFPGVTCLFTWQFLRDYRANMTDEERIWEEQRKQRVAAAKKGENE